MLDDREVGYQLRYMEDAFHTFLEGKDKKGDQSKGGESESRESEGREGKPP